MRLANLVSIPIFQHFVFSYSPEVVTVFLEKHLHNTFFVSKDRLVTISEIEAPDFDVLVR